MAHYRIKGGNKLNGMISVSGAKNAAVAIIPAVILCGEKCTLLNIPDIEDVRRLKELLEFIGATVEFDAVNSTMTIDPSTIVSCDLSCDLMRMLRASYYFLGALLGRYGNAKLALPGGCSIGERPIDIHIDGMKALGAEVTIDRQQDVLCAYSKFSKELFCSTGVIDFPKRSVGATINIMLAASSIKTGSVVMRNCAKEPHVVDVANFLNAMGASVMGAGTDVITINPAKSWHGCTYEIIPDQIETGTYMIAAAAAGGSVTLRNVIPKHMETLTQILRKCGVTVDEKTDTERDYITVTSSGLLKGVASVTTEPYPGFPTDLQQPLTAMLTIARGKSVVHESIFESRFLYTKELMRMGADITVVDENKTAVVYGVEKLTGTDLKITDLRAGAALVVAALAAEGESRVFNIHYLDRGYEKLEAKLSKLGAQIERIEDD